MNTGSDKISKVIVAITGASGAVYGLELIKQLVALECIKDIAVIYSENGSKVWDFEKVMDIPVSKKITVFENNDMFACPASGSTGYQAMFAAPCSMGTLASIAAGTAGTLILRAADVMLKERKPLILLSREAPLSLIHIKNMERVTQAGAIVFPASPFFYHHPKNLHEAISALISRLLSIAGISNPEFQWGKN
ncbi:MAG: UbiX family flavin prenyltransferase [Bacteroidales bacterium]|jgi:4-hydroxy-3-polyprenylbenzoate decarboxylase|nr:UbiX family flavin prenyltransferase [Bacteroidales bacterium]